MSVPKPKWRLLYTMRYCLRVGGQDFVNFPLLSNYRYSFEMLLVVSHCEECVRDV